LADPPIEFRLSNICGEQAGWKKSQEFPQRQSESKIRKENLSGNN